jgi:hypothetical protein
MLTVKEGMVGVAQFNGPPLEILSLFERYASQGHIVRDIANVQVYSDAAPVLSVTVRKNGETVTLHVPVGSPSGLTPWINVYTY